ncbi:hypothetical protein Gotri_015825 [Gossypium trilobum]|uniref:Protein farnesyltransferase subunit beta n=1 Tax=Gossypium trilobum TaxID=34281 RepID=A0A7J9E1J8_9ROSI|nr:hypothetical protein [Gossypium trilobum]
MESFRSLTVTQRDQILVEQQVFDIFKTFYNLPPSSQSFMLELQRENHVEYLTKGLTGLGPSFCVLDANRPWICYWILHSIALLDEFVDPELEDNTIDFLSRCQGPNGGYAGGPGQASKILDMIIVKLLPTIFCMLRVIIGDGLFSNDSYLYETFYFAVWVSSYRLSSCIAFQLYMRELNEFNLIFQMPHLATTYAAVNSLVTLGGDKALSSINRWSGYAIIEFEVFIGSYLTEVCNFLQRKTIHVFAANERCQWGIQYFLSIFNDFFSRMHDGGEIDVRACYTAISVASLLNILDDELVQNVGNYILSCQTYEGGISGEPGSEAHGGYTFCGLATMILINEVDRLDLSSLTDWVVFRQGVEGGFQGRTNKLVDGCYSFWQGGIFALLKRLNSTKGVKPIPLGDGEGSGEESPQTTASSDAAGEEGLNEDLSLGGSHSEIGGTLSCILILLFVFLFADQHNTSSQVNVIDIDHNHSKGHANVEPLFNSLALQQYILLCSQELNGGLRDKPGKSRDHYHTCYCLSGLSVCQRSWLEDEDSPPLPRAVLGLWTSEICGFRMYDRS